LRQGSTRIGAEEFEQFTADEIPEENPGFRPFLPGAALYAIDPSSSFMIVPVKKPE
jgi:hypothetical protein